jgi:hypothetical protein
LDREPLQPDVSAQLAQKACSGALKINTRKFSELVSFIAEQVSNQIEQEIPYLGKFIYPSGPAE